MGPYDHVTPPDVQIVPDLISLIKWCGQDERQTHVPKTLSSVFSSLYLLRWVVLPVITVPGQRTLLSNSFSVSTIWWAELNSSSPLNKNKKKISNTFRCLVFSLCYMWRVAYHGWCSVDCHITSSYSRGPASHNRTRMTIDQPTTINSHFMFCKPRLLQAKNGLHPPIATFLAWTS